MRADRSRLATLAALAFAVLYAAQLCLHIVRTSATVDEPVHVLAGYRHLTCADFGFNPEHPPLLKELAALPLLGLPVEAPPLACDAGFTGKQETFRLGNAFLIDNGIYPVLVPARLASAALSLLLAALLYLALRRMIGAAAAAVGVGMLALEPTMIAHGSLVTTDMAIATATFAAVAALYVAPDLRPWPRLAVTGAAFGFMLAAKHSALVIFPVLAVLVLADGRLRRGGDWRPSRQVPADLAFLAAGFAIGLALLWACYGFRHAAAPGQDHAVDLGQFLARVGRGGSGDGLPAQVLALLERVRLFPESYLMGLADIVGTSERPSRIFDRVYDGGRWSYFPIAFLLKSSIPLLLLFPVGAWALSRQPERRRALLFLTVPPIGYFLVSMTSGINIGIRHLLPVYPFLIGLASAAVVALWRRGGMWKAALVLLFAYQAAVVVRVSPHYIPFANDFWGGPDATYKVLSDTNVEWGQSLKEVERYVERHGVDRCWYAGVGPTAMHRAAQPCRLLPDGYRWVLTEEPLAPPVPRRIEGTVFLSVRMLPPRGGPEYAPLLEAGAKQMLAGTLLVFEGGFDLPQVAAISHARRADALVHARRYAEALAEGRRAVALAPEDPRTRISHGVALARSGALGQARAEEAAATRLLEQAPGRYGFVRHRLDLLRALLAADG